MCRLEKWLGNAYNVLLKKKYALFVSLAILFSVSLFSSCQNQIQDQTDIYVAKENIDLDDKGLAITFDYDWLDNYYLNLGKKLLLCKMDADKTYAVIAYELAGKIIMETINDEKERTFITSLDYLPEKLFFCTKEIIKMIAIPRREKIYIQSYLPSHLIFIQLPDKTYYMAENPYYAPLDEKYSYGIGNKAAVTNIRLTANGLNIEFGPQYNEETDPFLAEAEFITAYARLPIMDFYFDTSTQTGRIIIHDTQIGLDGSLFTNKTSTDAIQKATVRQESDTVIIELLLNEHAQYYNVNQEYTLNDYPIAIITFKFEQPPYF